MKKTLLASLIALSLLASPFSVLAWTEPGSFPPNNNVGAPIHIGPEAQTKSGALTILGNTSAAIKGFMVGSNTLILQNATQNLIYGNVDTASQGNLLNLQVEDVTKFIVDKDGNVGIGTGTPGAKLHIRTGATAAPFTAGYGLIVENPNKGGVTAKNVGIYGIGEKWLNNESAVGVWGHAITSANNVTLYGVYGTVNQGGGTGINAYAGYFEGRGYFSDNVGIGTNNPLAALDMGATGGIRLGGVTRTTWPASGVGGNGIDNYIPRWNGTGALENSSIYQIDNGNVGIGTATPAEKLDVVGNIAINNGKINVIKDGSYSVVEGLRLWNPSNSHAGSKITFAVTDSVGIESNITGQYYDFTGAQDVVLDFNTWVGGNVMRLSRFGVGIGSTGKIGSRLTVKGFGNTNSSSALDIQNSNGTSGFFVRDDGNVGIGVVAPTQKLDIAGDVNITGVYRVNGTPIAVGGGTEWTTSGNDISNTNTGGVGIGAAVPTEKLDVRGDIFVQGDDGFDAAGETAQITLGDGNHFIKAINGGGVEIGSFMSADPIRFTFNGIDVMTIHSTGSVYAPLYRFTSPITRYYVINPSEFTGHYYNTQFEIKDDGAAIGNYNNTGGIYLSAPVHLPNGATITEMKAYMYRNDPAFASRAYIVLYRFDTQKRYPIIAEINANSHTDGWRELWASSVLNEVISNVQYGYLILASINVNDNNNDVKLGKIIITYTIDAPLP